jgi:hypothetical protein
MLRSAGKLLNVDIIKLTSFTRRAASSAFKALAQLYARWRE